MMLRSVGIKFSCDFAHFDVNFYSLTYVSYPTFAQKDMEFARIFVEMYKKSPQFSRGIIFLQSVQISYPW